MANLGRNLVERRGDYRECREIVRMSVALNHLRRHRGRLQSQPGADFLFEFRREMRKRPHRAGELSDAQILTGSLEAGYIALRLGIPVGDFESERDRLGVDAMRPPAHWRVL